MSRVVFENEATSFLKLAYPHEDLRSIVEYYFEVDTQREATIFGLPSINAALSFQLKNTASSFNEKTKEWITLPRVALLGNTSVPFSGRYGASSSVFYVKLRPLAKALLSDHPGHALLNASHDFESALKGFSFAKLQDLSGFSERVGYIEEWLRSVIAAKTLTDKQRCVQAFVDQLNTARYVQPETVDAVCSRMHVTYATLRRYCHSELGVSPKFLQKAVRFKSALRAYRQHGYTFNAYDFGFTDFSHFCKDAKELTGRRPAEL